MSTATETIEDLVKTEYKYGFFTELETESAPPGLSEDTIRLISRKKNEPEWLTEWRLTPKEEAERAKQAAASLENFMREGNGNTDESHGG